jgi:hypothetical protein
VERVLDVSFSVQLLCELNHANLDQVICKQLPNLSSALEEFAGEIGYWKKQHLGNLASLYLFVFFFGLYDMCMHNDRR